MGKPKVSIIVPVYNVEKYLDRCIQSLLNQTLKEIEIIMVDDESPDNCPVICDNYSRQDTRIKVIHKKNAGLGLARNSGIEIATGEYIAFLDSDDYVSLDMYESMYLKANEMKLDAFFCRFCRVSSRGLINLYSNNNDIEIFDTTSDIQEALINMIGSDPSYPTDRKYEVSACTVIYKNDIVKKNKIMFLSEREIISEDMFFQIDYLQFAKKIAFTNKTYYYYCLNEVSLSNSFRTDRFEKYIVLHEEVKRRLNTIFTDDRNLLSADRMFMGYTRSLLLTINKYKISTKEKFKILNIICNNSIWVEISQRYPLKKLPIKHYFFIFLINRKMIYTIFLISKFEKYIRIIK